MRRMAIGTALLLVFLFAVPQAVYAAAADRLGRPLNTSFTYNFWGVPVQSPDPYELVAIVTGSGLGIGDFRRVTDLTFDADGYAFLADSMNNRIVKLAPDLSLVKVYDRFEEIEPPALNQPSGVFVTDDGYIYISDTFNSRIIKITRDGTVVQVFPEPEDPLLPAGFTYRPMHLAVDAGGRVFVISHAFNMGIITLNPDGSFGGFLAAARVTPTAWQIFWRRMADFVPVEYTSMDMDDEGFLLTITATVSPGRIMSEVSNRAPTEGGSPVRRLNMNGQDIMRRNGYFPPVGDVYNLRDTSPAFSGVSNFTDVAAGMNGTFYLLDNNRKRVFAYDEDGFLLYAFGGPGASVGGFITPVAIAAHQDRLMVADDGDGTVSFFVRTEYGNLIHSAISYHNMGLFRQAEEAWRLVLARNANFEMAYVGIGRALFRENRYQDAMRYFRLGNHREWYSRAFAEHRNLVIAQWLPVVMGTIILLLVGSSLLQFIKYLRNYRRGVIEL